MPSLEYNTVARRAEEFIRRQVSAAGADGVVFGLSGGVDSAVTAYLCGRALGNDRCMALIMPNSESTPPSETADGILVADSIPVQRKIIQIDPISKAVIGDDTLESSFDGNRDLMRYAIGNMNARLRAVLLYYEAQKRNYLVVGTDDKSEHVIGYFTKYGDGACDILPIADLYKTEIWELARFLGVPSQIVNKEPSPHLWPGHVASGELGLDYTRIDSILRRMEDDAFVIADELGIRQDKVERILGLHTSSVHKRRPPPVADVRQKPKSDVQSAHEPPSPVKSSRPWGYFERFTLNKTSTVKLIQIRPGASLSLQLHNNRSEFWRVISGSAMAVIDGRTVSLAAGDDLFVPSGSIHRLTGGKESGARVLEIAIGDFSESDIVRLEDGWGRK